MVFRLTRVVLVLAAFALAVGLGPASAQEEPAPTEVPVTTAPDPGPSTSTEGGAGRVEGEGSDILIVAAIAIGGLIVVGMIVHFTGRARDRRMGWKSRARSAYEDAVWVHETLVPGRFGRGLEARSLAIDARRRVVELKATLAGLEIDAPDSAARNAAAELSTTVDALLSAFESDLAVRGGQPDAVRESDLDTTAAAVARRRAEMDAALTQLRAAL